jgi:uncharacterized protein
MTDLETRFERMQESLRGMRRVAVAFSAGVDSTFVLKAACDALGAENVVAVTGRSDSVAEAELEAAARIAADLGVRHVVLATREFENPRYLANPTNRCYFCKTELYGKLGEFVRAEGYHVVVNGVNADDLSDHRPGLRAAREFGVRAPAAEAGLGKADIRELSRRLGLPTAEKPASPCLSSRVQYGEEITPDKLRRIERAEALLHELGFGECRVRHHGPLARIEVPADRLEELLRPEVRRRIDAGLRALGYLYVTADLGGLSSGSMNRVIAFGRVQPPV